MAEEISKLYDVKVQGSDALKTLAELRLRSQALKEEQKQLGPITADNAEQYYRLDSQIKAVNKEATAYQKQITNSIKLQNEQEKSLEALRAQLSLDNAEFAKLGNAQKDAARKAELGDRIAATTAELKKQEEALGDHHRSIGDYEKAGKSLRTEARKIMETLVEMKLARQDDSEEYQAMAARLAELKDAMADVNNEASGRGSDTANLDALMQSAQGVVAAYGLWKSTSAALGIENEALDKTMQSLTIVMTALQSLTAIQNALQKDSIVYVKAHQLLQKIGINQTARETKALAAKNAMLGATTVGTKLVSAATWLWNAALSANPLVIVTLATAALAVGVGFLTGAFGKNVSAQKEFERTSQDVEKAIRKVDAALKDELAGIDLNTRKLILAAKERGASASEIAEIELKSIEQTAEANKKAAEERIAQINKERDAELAALGERQSRLDNAGKKDSVRAEMQKELSDEAAAALDAYNQKIGEQVSIINDAAQTIKEKAHEVGKVTVDEAQKTTDAVKAAIKKSLDMYLDASQQRQKIEEETLKAQNVFQSQYIKTRQNFERDLFEIQQAGEKERLAARLKSGDITAKQYADEYKLLSLKSEQFYSKQADDQNKYFADARSRVLAAAGKDTEMQIAEVITAYNSAMKDLAAVEKPIRVAGMSDAEYQKALDEYEEFLFNRAELELRLTKKMEDDVASIRESAIETQYQKITTAIEKEYQNDFDRYANNEAKKLQLTIESLQKRIAALKAAGLSTATEEAALQAAISQQNALNLERQLRDQRLSIKERHDLVENALLAELELWKGNADKIDEINAQLAENDRAAFEARAELAGQYMSAMGDMLGALNDLFSAMDEQRLQDIQARYDREQAMLDDQLGRGLMTQKEYDKRKSKLDAAKAKEEAKIAREQAIRERILASFSVAMNTAMGIMNAVSTFWMTGGLPWSAIIGALGAVQMAAIWAAPLPKAARGQYVRGKSHASGGVQMEVEGGEAVINKRSASMFLPLLSAINEMGGGIPFTTPGADGGYSLRSAAAQSAGVSKADIADAMAEAVSQVTVVATIEDIRREDRNYAKIESRGVI